MVHKTFLYEFKIFNAIFFAVFGIFLACVTDLSYGQQFNGADLLGQLRASGSFSSLAVA